MSDVRTTAAVQRNRLLLLLLLLRAIFSYSMESSVPISRLPPYSPRDHGVFVRLSWIEFAPFPPDNSVQQE